MLFASGDGAPLEYNTALCFIQSELPHNPHLLNTIIKKKKKTGKVHFQLVITNKQGIKLQGYN